LTSSEQQFGLFYERTSRPLWRYLYRMSGDASAADDLHQESYLRILTRPPRAGSERELAAYLYRIATNLWLDRWRRQQRESRSLSSSPPRPQSRESAVPAKVDVRGVLEKLKPRERSLLWLAYVEEYEHREIAEILGLKPASIRVLLFRARRRLAKILQRRGLGAEVLG
jgi:RNA polymerase sigma-70 factor (ECF subfamily)